MTVLTFRNKTTLLNDSMLSDVILPILDMRKDFNNNQVTFYENLFDDIYFTFDNSKNDSAQYQIFLDDKLSSFSFNGITINLDELEELKQSEDFYNILDNFSMIEQVTSLKELVEKVNDDPFRRI